MDIVRNDAEEQLFEDLSAASRFMPELRCIHFKRASSEEKRKDADKQTAQALAGDTLSASLAELSKFFFGREARIFACHDGDVFVLANGLTQQDLSDFLHHLEAKLGPASFLGLAYLFEVGVDWPKLRVLCERKFESLKRLCRTSGNVSCGGF